MSKIAEAHMETYDEISLADIFNWLVKWWWAILVGALIGIFAGTVFYLATEEKYTVRVDFSIAQTPLGSDLFIKDISAGFLRKNVDGNVTIQMNNPRGALSLIENGVEPEMRAARQKELQDAAEKLASFLETRLSQEFAGMQASFETMPPSPEAYSELMRYRLYLSALEENLLEPVTISSQKVRLQGFPLAILLLLGAALGAGIGMISAFVVDEVRRHRGNPVT